MGTLSNRWNAKEEYPKISISGGLRQKDVLKHSKRRSNQFQNFLNIIQYFRIQPSDIGVCVCEAQEPNND